MKKNDYDLWRDLELIEGLQNELLFEFIIESITNGTIKPNAPLPSYRALAGFYGINRSTVSRVYFKLQQQGWLDSIPGSGTFVSPTFPGYEAIYPFSRVVNSLPIKLKHTNSQLKPILEEQFQNFTTIGFDTPSPQYFPAWQYYMFMHPHSKSYQTCTQTQQMIDLKGDYLKDAILAHLNGSRAFGINSHCLEIIMGRKESLDSVLRSLISPGDILVNTSPKDILLCNALKQCKAEYHNLSMLDTEFIQNLEDILAKTAIKAIYLRPQCSYPESYYLSPATCLQLVELAKKHRFYILEEDDYHEFWYEKYKFEPLVCYEHEGHVIYMGALSLISPYIQNIRTIVAATEFIEILRSASIKTFQFRDLLQEKAIADFLNSKKFWYFSKRMRQAKKNHWEQAWLEFDNYLRQGVKILKPSSGLSFWLQFQSAESLQESMALLTNIGFKIPYHPDSQKPGPGVFNIRLGFGSWDINEAQDPAKILQEKFSLDRIGQA
ncbi:PLP-dependent aminotransferase family protein [Pedobacter sp. B4-66]|uniref:GntR family transcriptional regulator n=1 Tax=Pedobacter sp. B4-66 TaxID=2817280 RepID=UPI001BDB6448|nr:PLP-dependent aminotransferase family protein [Pedobacter sp. B4-66]